MAPPPRTLVVVPTRLEASHLDRLGGFSSPTCRTALLGFGPVAAAARCAALIAEEQPARVVLIGIAGTYDAQSLPVGAAATFGQVALEGVGVGSGAAFEPPSRMGFPQWPGGQGTAAGAVLETLELEAAEDGLLLTVCSASADAGEAERRARTWRGARAEDMEAFGAAFACTLAGVPLLVVRGISNVAGMRDTSAWKVAEALDSARSRALALLAELEDGGRA